MTQDVLDLSAKLTSMGIGHRIVDPNEPRPDPPKPMTRQDYKDWLWEIRQARPLITCDEIARACCRRSEWVAELLAEVTKERAMLPDCTKIVDPAFAARPVPETPLLVREIIHKHLRALVADLDDFDQTTHGLLAPGTLESVNVGLLQCYRKPDSYTISDLAQRIRAFLRTTH